MIRPLFYVTKLFSQIKLGRAPTDYDHKDCSLLKIFLETSCLGTCTSQAYSQSVPDHHDLERDQTWHSRLLDEVISSAG